MSEWEEPRPNTGRGRSNLRSFGGTPGHSQWTRGGPDEHRRAAGRQPKENESEVICSRTQQNHPSKPPNAAECSESNTLTANKGDSDEQRATEAHICFCGYCGDEFLNHKEVHPEGKKVYHVKCHCSHIPRSKEAVKKFKELVPGNQKILVIGINVSYLYGKDKEDKSFRRAKKKKRDNKIQELLKYVSALRNSCSGYVLIHLVGLQEGDTFMGAFDTFADDKLRGLIHDGKQFDDVYKKQKLNKKLAGFDNFLVLYVAGATSLTTSDFKTKQALDESIIDPSPDVIRTFIEDRKTFKEQFHELESVKSLQDLENIQESRSVQLKGNFLEKVDPQELVTYVFNGLRLAEYISAFTKLEVGGSFIYGVAEKRVPKGNYQSQTVHVQPLLTKNLTGLRDLINRKTLDTVLICDYDGEVQDINPVQVNFIPPDPDREAVLHVAVRPVTGLVFYDKSGPLAYRYDEDTGLIRRFTVKEWFIGIRHHVQKTQTDSGKIQRHRKCQSYCVKYDGKLNVVWKMGLLTRILQEEEKEFALQTRDFLRPGLKQIGNSVVDIKKHYVPGADLYIVPLHFEGVLKEVKEDLFQVLEKTTMFHEKCILTRKADKLHYVQTKRKGFIFLSESLASVLSIDFSLAKVPSSVKCDVLIALPHQPVMVLTLVDEHCKADASDEAVRYNVSVASAMIKTFERFTFECVNPVFGVLNISALKDVHTFSSHIDSFVQNSSLFVTLESLTMTPVRYENILTAVWAGVAETKSVVSASDQVDITYLRFLTKEQCIVLVENINNREVKVRCQPGCGATTLMLEVARRLVRLGNTLLVCGSEKERNRLRNDHPVCTIIGLSDLEKTDFSQFENIVDGTGQISDTKRKRLWTFIKDIDAGSGVCSSDSRMGWKLQEMIEMNKEETFTLQSMDVLRLRLKQIENSVYEIKNYYTSGAEVCVVPSDTTATLKEVRTCLQELAQSDFLYEQNILTGQEIENHLFLDRRGFMSLAESLFLCLSIDSSISSKPSPVKCDVFIALPHQPVMVLTLIDGDSESDEAVRYNVSVASAMIKTFERFTDECVNPVFGVISMSALRNVHTLKNQIASFVKSSSLFVTMDSMSTTNRKYEKILTAFWAGVAETKSVVSASGQVDSTYLRFLTKDQCIVLVENINNRKVKVICQPRCGATTLMLEVARRLSGLGETLLVCESEEERDRLRSVHANTVSLTNLRTVDLSEYMNVVDETGTVDCVAGRLWKFTREEAVRGRKRTFRATEIQQGLFITTQLEQDIREGRAVAYSAIQDVLLRLGNLVETLREEYANTESLLQVLKFGQRQEKMKYLLREVGTLALIDMKIRGMHAQLYTLATTKTEPLKISSSKQLSIDTVKTTYTLAAEDFQLSVMRELHLGISELEIHKGRDLFSLIRNVTIRDKKIRNYLESKAVFLKQATKQEERPNKESISTATRKHIDVVEAGKTCGADRHELATEKEETYRICSRQIMETVEGDDMIPIHGKHKNIVGRKLSTAYKSVRGVVNAVEKSVSERNIQTKDIDGVMNPTSDGLLDPSSDGLKEQNIDGLMEPGNEMLMETGSDGLMEPGSEGLKEPGSAELMEPGSDELKEQGNEMLMESGSDRLMEPGSEGLKEPGSDWLMEPGIDRLIQPGIDVLMEPGSNNEGKTGGFGHWVEKPSVFSGKAALEEVVQLKNTLTGTQKDMEKQEAELNTKDCVPEWEYNLALLSRNIAAMTIKEDIMHVIGEDDLPVPVFQSLEKQRGGVENKTPVLHHLRQFQLGTVKCTEIFGILQNIIKDDQKVLPELRHKCLNLEKVYGGPVHIVGELESYRSHFVSCPIMKLDKSRVNTNWCHVSTDGGTLVNRLDRGQYNKNRGQYNTDRFRQYYGTCSSPPIPLPPSPSTLTAPRYWESHSRISVPVRNSLRTLLEMAICGVGEVDTRPLAQTRSSWAVRVVVCITHGRRSCTQVWGEGRQVGECYDTKSITPNTTVVYKYGVVLDVGRGRVAFLDLDRDIVIEKMDVRITQPLRAMFGVWPRYTSPSGSDTQMKLVSGGEIAMTDNKQSLIYKALSV